jgi:heptosyltransferase I
MNRLSASPPRSICILRLSALGDATHVVPLVHTLRAGFPDAAITWVIGKLEAKLVGDLPGVRFVVVDKARGWRAWSDLRRALAGERHDVLLQCQVALRANLLAQAVIADRRVGFDRARSKELHGLRLTDRIPTGARMHQLDAIGSFAVPLGLLPGPPRWDIPISAADRAVAAELLPGDQPTLLVSPCSSHARRNWRADRYAAVADHAVRRHGLRVALCGGRSATERSMGDAILAAMREPALDLIGRDTLKQFLALCRRSIGLLTPDSGPMHMANAVGTPVLGLHAASNPARTGPYSDRRWCVDRYDAAARRFRGVPADALPWGTRLEYDGVMDLVETEAVIERLDRLVDASALPRPD